LKINNKKKFISVFFLQRKRLKEKKIKNEGKTINVFFNVNLEKM